MSEEALKPAEMKEVDEAKREFITKFGKYAATAPLGMYLLMGPGASKAQASGSSCHIHGHFNWGKCHIVKFNAHGNQQGHCEVLVKVSNSKIGKVKLDIYNKQTVVIHTPTGRDIKLSMDFIKKNMKGWPIYTVLDEISMFV